VSDPITNELADLAGMNDREKAHVLGKRGESRSIEETERPKMPLSEFAALRAERDSLLIERDRLRLAYSDAREALVRVAAERDSLTAERDALRAELDEANGKVEALENEWAYARERLEDLKRERDEAAKLEDRAWVGLLQRATRVATAEYLIHQVRSVPQSGFLVALCGERHRPEYWEPPSWFADPSVFEPCPKCAAENGGTE
jgi:chromosome segregation ATPase